MNNPMDREPTITEMRIYLRLLDALGIMTIFVCLVFWKLEFNGVFLGFFSTVSAVLLFELLGRSYITRRLIADKRRKDRQLKRLYDEINKDEDKNNDERE